MSGATFSINPVDSASDAPDTATAEATQIAAALAHINRPFCLVMEGGALVLRYELPTPGVSAGQWEAIRAVVPAVPVHQLGDAGFRRTHGLRYAYYAGAMANGIASVELVEAMSRGGMLGFFGAAGLAPSAVEAAIVRLGTRLGPRPYGFNLIHSPSEPELEEKIVSLYLQRGVSLIEASAYLELTLPLVRYRLHGIHRGADGQVVAPNRVIAKVSRVEVAQKFFSPPSAMHLQALCERGDISTEQARLAEGLPLAQDVTAEADSGGHTDRRPAIALLPTLLALRDRCQPLFPDLPLRVGLAGGIATPASAAAAFAMGAAYIVTGSVNQACVESGSSDAVRRLLAEAAQADVAMAPAADMFEMGVTLQVLKRGTLFPQRASRLYQLYREYQDLEALPAGEREKLEQTYFRDSIENVWAQTRAFFLERDPRQVARAESDPRHRMALVFRSYLGQSSRWANAGVPERQVDYQVWCGPAMGAFNEWVRGSFLERPERRNVRIVAQNLLYGAAVTLRAQMLRSQGVEVPGAAMRVLPKEESELREYVS